MFRSDKASPTVKHLLAKFNVHWVFLIFVPLLLSLYIPSFVEQSISILILCAIHTHFGVHVCVLFSVQSTLTRVLVAHHCWVQLTLPHEVWLAHSFWCPYRDIASTPYLVPPHQNFYSADCLPYCPFVDYTLLEVLHILITMLKKDVHNYDECLQRSVVGEFNTAQIEMGKQTCSNGSACNWLKKHRLKLAICPQTGSLWLLCYSQQSSH